jgi:hypothetical protein
MMERTIPVGKWRINTEIGLEVLRVFIKGMRDRPFELRRVTREDFDSRLVKTPNGKVIDTTVLRGLPSCFTTEGSVVLIWPSPAHQWKMQFEVRK